MRAELAAQPNAPDANAASVTMRRAMLTQWVMLLLFLGTLAALLGYKLLAHYRDTETHERLHLLTQARVIGANLNEQLVATYRTLTTIRDDTRGVNSTQLKALAATLRGVRTLNLLDRNGIALASNRDELLGKNFSTRDYFQSATRLDDPGAVVLSAPFKTALGAWGMNMALPVRGAGNEFAGMITATLDQNYFGTLLSSVLYAPDMRSSIVHGDGVIFSVVPARDDVDGLNLVQPGAFFTQHLQSGRTENTFSGTAFTTGDQRLCAMVTVQPEHTNRTLVVAVNRALDAVFFDWRQDAFADALVLLALIVTATIGLALYQRRQSVTEQHAAQTAAQLRQSEARFRAIIEASPVPFALNDAQQNITYLNAAFTGTFGYTSSDIPTLADWWPRAYPDTEYRNWVVATWTDNMQSAQRERRPMAPLELNICCRDGTVRTVLVSASPLGASFADKHLVVLYDITERKSAENERDRLHSQLRQAQKMEAVGQLTGGIAHDFNNILAAILGYTELMREQLPRPADGALMRNLDQIQRAGERARDLIAKMLAFARGTAGEPRALEPRATIQDILGMLRPTLPAAIKLEIDIDAELTQIRADPVQLHQIVANLLLNARDALPGTGHIRVGLYRARAHAATCSACGELVTGEYFTLTVNDDGVGIAPESLPHIFNPFYTTKAIGKGSGLGLSVVHGIVHELGGHMLVDSDAVNGTTFRVLFPYLPPQDAATHTLERTHT